ncbi:MAG: bacterioferritin [Halothiobacillaceae bacterium]
MSKKSKSLKNLQTALSMELTASHQYLLHAHLLEDWGLDKLASKMREEIQEELGHASSFIERILFLNGDPKVSEEKPATRAKSLKDMFESDLAEERNAIAFYTQAVIDANEEGDIGTRRLFESIVLDEEGHADWLSLQIDLLERMGEPNFIAKYHSGMSGKE